MMSRSQRSGCFARLSGLVMLVFIFGCASPGTPRAPSLHLPDKIKSLSAERHGNNVVVRFATPERTTDDQPIKTPVMASLCRSVADGPCGPTSSFPAKVKIAGAVEWVDVLPAALAAGTPRRLTYSVELFNADGRSAGPSAPVFVAAGEGPQAVEAFRAEGSHDGIVLRWTPEAKGTGEVLVKREDLNAPAPKAPAVKKPAPAAKGVGGRKIHSSAPAKAGVGASKDESTVWLHGENGTNGGDRSGLIDATAKADEPYRYTAVRRRGVTLDGRDLEIWSEASKAVEITMTDVFPPGVPQGLVVAGFPVEGSDTLAADLAWQPDTESDLAGYNVYKQVLGADGSAGSVWKLNSKLVELPSFHDAMVARGVAYRYTVTAVDSKGNESAASVAADLAATP
jgi:hypothetical protein